MSTAELPRSARSGHRSGFGRGVLLGLLIGGLVWAAYFVQASTWDHYSWDVTVVPTLGALAVGALAWGLARPAVRRPFTGVALGTLLTLPVVLGVFLLLFHLLGLE